MRIPEEKAIIGDLTSVLEKYINKYFSVIQRILTYDIPAERFAKKTAIHHKFIVNKSKFQFGIIYF
jgi:hypothetical protein